MPGITVATYNIHRCYGIDRRFSPERIRKVLEELDTDIIALQEVETYDDGGFDLLKFLSGDQYQPIAGPTLLRHNAQYGNALLSRLPIKQVFQHDLTVPDREPRGAIDARIQASSTTFRIVATHFGLSIRERRLQAQRILELIEPQAESVEILLGDLNEWFLWGRPLRWLHRAFAKTPSFATFPACFPLLALDRLWVRPNIVLKRLQRHDSPIARIASDHLPLRAELELPTRLTLDTQE
ncbi:endonuclease/exonuclease/phosphatase family protein [Nitrosomonas sp.]|uniref:endonuclease/exonuclease/phosphatase family protein n=1 Tax=Nitrosomonas sp. TaxID=42353 RepID=UPI002609FB9A|nr:endonuclease/exonuclease/phosphatase family protein [Nitrosomonas sp.]MCW5601208.1 endonuclease/exonuclease/phosphatase family protein [Nitrosomonas sp.]